MTRAWDTRCRPLTSTSIKQSNLSNNYPSLLCGRPFVLPIVAKSPPPPISLAEEEGGITELLALTFGMLSGVPGGLWCVVMALLGWYCRACGLVCGTRCSKPMLHAVLDVCGPREDMHET